MLSHFQPLLANHTHHPQPFVVCRGVFASHTLSSCVVPLECVRIVHFVSSSFVATSTKALIWVTTTGNRRCDPAHMGVHFPHVICAFLTSLLRIAVCVLTNVVMPNVCY